MAFSCFQYQISNFQIIFYSAHPFQDVSGQYDSIALL